MEKANYYDYSLLKKLIQAAGGTEEVARRANLDPAILEKCLAGKREFYASEINAIKNVLHLDSESAMKAFFAVKPWPGSGAVRRW